MQAHNKTSLYDWLLYLIPPALLSAITALVYYPSLHYEFQFDDLANITKHFNIRHNTLRTLYFSGTRWISYWLNAIHYSIGRFDPFSYRVGNLLIHTCNGLLVYFIVRIMLSLRTDNSFFTRNKHILAIVTSLLFLLHPVQTQTVSYVIQGELEGLAAFFILAITLTFLKLASAQTFNKKIGLSALLFCLAALSTGSKEIAIISPVLMLLIDWFFVAQGSLHQLKKRWWIHGGLFAIVGGLYVWLLKPHFFTQVLGLQMEAKNNIGNVITHNPAHKITPLHYFISQFKVILHYLAIFVYPLNISVEYDWKLVENFLAPDCFLPFLGLVTIFTSLYYLLRKNSTHLIGFGMVWFFVAIAPRSTIVPSPELLVDYKTYPASFGWLFVIAAGLIWGYEKILNYLAVRKNPSIHLATLGTQGERKNNNETIGTQKNHPSPLILSGCEAAVLKDKAEQTHTNAYKIIFQFASLLILITPLSYLTIERNGIWKSGLNFWQSMIDNAPGKARAYNNYGVELSQKLHKFKESIPYFQKAIAMDRHYPDPCNNLAVAYASTEQIDKAIEAMKMGLRINRRYPEGYNNLASFYLRKKEYEFAEASLNEAIRLRPYYGKAYFNKGRMYLDQGKKELAWQCFKKCCTEADLDNELGFNALGKCSLSLNKHDDAIFAFTKMLELNHNNREARFNLGNAYFMKKEYKKALYTYEQAHQRNPSDTRVWNNIGETLYCMKDHKRALPWFQKICNARPSSGNAYLRLAECYERTGNPKQSATILAQLNKQKMDANTRLVLNSVIGQFNKTYPDITIA